MPFANFSGFQWCPKCLRIEFSVHWPLTSVSLSLPLSPPQSHVQLFKFQNDDSDVNRLLERAMLVKRAYELIAEGDTHEEVLSKLASDPSSSLESFDHPNQSWCLLLRPQQRKRSGDYIRSVVEQYTALPLLGRAPVDLMRPKNVFTVIEMYQGAEATPSKVYFTRLGRGHLKTLFSLDCRRYIGNSTMDPELAFIQANLANARPGTVVMDPFCGTGGLLLPAAHFGSSVFGVEIKWDVARAKGKSSRAGEQWLSAEHSIHANFEQYGMCDGRFLGVVLADSSRPKLWHHLTADGTIDAIITDPPYGIRERGQRLGSDKRKTTETINGDDMHKYGQLAAETEQSAKSESFQKKGIGNEDEIAQFGAAFPEKQKYEMSNIFLDLVDLSARLLRLGGRLAFWFPVCRSEYSDRFLPRVGCMRLVHNCEQTLAKDSSRRLLVYEKFRQPLTEGTEQRGEKASFELDCYADETFHQKVFGSK